jgi:hypothetical protein
MKNMTKHIMIAALLTSPVWSAPEPVKPALSIAPFTMKSSDGSMEIKMDDAGKLHFGGKHVATAHAEGKLTSPDGELLAKLNETGIALGPDGSSGGDPIEITREGTWKQGGAALAWVDGKLDFGRGHFSITPEDSPSKRVATLCVLVFEAGGPDGSLMSSETKFGPHTLVIEPAPKVSGTESREGAKIVTADKNKFELRDGDFWFNGKNYGKLPEDSKIHLKNDVLTINGKKADAP